MARPSCPPFRVQPLTRQRRCPSPPRYTSCRERRQPATRPTTSGPVSARRLLHRAHVTTITMLVAASLTAPLAGCGGGGLDEQLETLHSWGETLQFAATLQQRGAITRRAYRQLRDAARDAL